MKRKILVLEDEENIRSFLVLNLKRSGYEVIEAETGEIALEKYHENQDIAVAAVSYTHLDVYKRQVLGKSGGPHPKQAPEEHRKARKTLVIGGMCCGTALCAGSITQQFALLYTPVGKAGFLTACYILIVPLLGLLFGRDVYKRQGHPVRRSGRR